LFPNHVWCFFQDPLILFLLVFWRWAVWCEMSISLFFFLVDLKRWSSWWWKAEKDVCFILEVLFLSKSRLRLRWNKICMNDTTRIQSKEKRWGFDAKIYIKSFESRLRLRHLLTTVLTCSQIAIFIYNRVLESKSLKCWRVKCVEIEGGKEGFSSRFSWNQQ